MRIIENQVVAGTNLDLHGEQIAPEVLVRLFAQMADPMVNHSEHDGTRSPVTRMSNKRLVQRPDGSLAIVVDIEVLDEVEFARMGGFSIAFTNRTIRIGGQPCIQILINPRQLPFEEIARDLAALTPPGYSIDITERIEKTAVADGVIVIVALTVAGVAKGFLSKVGAELFEYLKRRRGGTSTKEPAIQIEGTVDVGGRAVTLLLAVDPSVSATELTSVDLDAAAVQLERMAKGAGVNRAVGFIRPGPVIEVTFLVRPDGSIARAVVEGQEGR